jgi:hypothetical protein
MANERMGTWLRGADGALYCIPDSDLESFRVPEKIARAALNELDSEDVVPFGGPQPEPPTIIATKSLLGQPASLAASNEIVPPAGSLRGLRWPGK